MQNVEVDPGLVAQLRRLSRVAAALAAVIAVIVLLGWVLGIEVLKSGLPGLSTMKTNAAISTLLIAVGLLLWQPRGAGRWPALLSRGAATLAGLVALLTLLQYMLGIDLGIDQMLFEEQPGVIGTFSPNRMAPNLAFAVLAAAIAVLLLGSRSREVLLTAQVLAVMTGLVGLLALVGYAYGVAALIAIGPFTNVALPAAVSLLLLSLSILHARPDEGLVAVITSSGFGGVLTRRLLPVVLLAPLLLGLLILQGARADLYDEALAMSLLAVSSVVLFAVLVWSTAAYIDRIDAERREVELERARLARHLEMLLASTDEGLYGIDVEGNCTFINRAACRMTGYDQEEVLGRNVHELIHYWHPDGTPYDVQDCPIYRALHGGVGVRVDREVFWHRDGTPFPVEYSSFPISEDGIVRGSVVTFTDITRRRQAEEQIRKLNRDLVERANDLVSINRELEAFSYSVSHDLRAPLRSIDGFSQALLEDYSDRLDEDGQDYLRRVRAASQRMGQLIDDMLNLSRVTRSEMNRERLDLSGIAESILEELRARSPDREVEVRVARGLEADADPRLLRVVLQNLLENAWKFTSTTPAARIEVGAISRDGERAFFVRDNGAGFDMTYSGKLFGAFQRLHGHAEYAGTGIGLATVQRIVHRHGGRVWAEGKVDEGAAFYFTLQ
jgi:PAS domain S-box-containing protein